MKQLKPYRPKREVKKEMNTMDALMNDYKSNKNMYNELIESASLSHQFLEEMYLKYSRSLEIYMKKNKKGLKLSGNKKYVNVPVDLFIKESRKYKEEIIKNISSKNANVKVDQFFLTPLPDKPRILLVTEQEKREFLSAERAAVVMRTFEYTNQLRQKGMAQYYQMKDDEKQEMIYIMKKAADIIQGWWGKKMKQLKEKKERIKKNAPRYAQGVETMNNLLNNRKKNLINDFFSRLKNYKSIQDSQSKKSYRKRDCFDPEELEKEHFDIDLSVNKWKTKSIQAKEKLNKILNKVLLPRGRFESQISLYKYFIKWLLFVHHFSSNRHQISMALAGKGHGSGGYVPTYLSYLPTVLLTKFQNRFRDVFHRLRDIQKASKGISGMIHSIQQAGIRKGMDKIKENVKYNALLKAIIDADIQGKKWKYFQLWNLKNTLVHIFVSKLIKFAFSFSKRRFFRNIKKKGNFFNEDLLNQLQKKGSIKEKKEELSNESENGNSFIFKQYGKEKVRPEISKFNDIVLSSVDNKNNDSSGFNSPSMLSLINKSAKKMKK